MIEPTLADLREFLSRNPGKDWVLMDRERCLEQLDTIQDYILRLRKDRDDWKLLYYEVTKK